MRIVRQLLGAAIAAAVIASPVMAEELTGTLKKIKDSGTITLGHRDSSIPFSYLAGKPEPVGYSHDIQLAVVDALKSNWVRTSRSATTWSPPRPASRWCRTAPWTLNAAPPPTTSSASSRSASVGIFEVGTRLLTKVRTVSQPTRTSRTWPARTW